LSSDDHGFWDAKGVTLDYVYAFCTWDLDLKDLKQLLKNSIDFSSTDEEYRI
jgi:adenosine deaminase